MEKKGGEKMPKKYYIPGMDQLNQVEETPSSKRKTEQKRFIINAVIGSLSALAAIVAAVFSILAYFGN